MLVSYSVLTSATTSYTSNTDLLIKLSHKVCKPESCSNAFAVGKLRGKERGNQERRKRGVDFVLHKQLTLVNGAGGLCIHHRLAVCADSYNLVQV